MKVIAIPQTVQTSNGELTINLNLTITINQEGFSISADSKETKREVNLPDITLPDALFAIPEFETNKTLLDFGDDSTR